MVANANPSGVHSQLNTVVELIFKLCCNIPNWGYDNLVTLVKWLESVADQAIEVRYMNLFLFFSEFFIVCCKT